MDHLPKDVICFICREYLTLVEICLLRRVCKRFSLFCDDPSIWSRIFQRLSDLKSNETLETLYNLQHLPKRIWLNMWLHLTAFAENPPKRTRPEVVDRLIAGRKKSAPWYILFLGEESCDFCEVGAHSPSTPAISRRTVEESTSDWLADVNNGRRVGLSPVRSTFQHFFQDSQFFSNMSDMQKRNFRHPSYASHIYHLCLDPIVAEEEEDGKGFYEVLIIHHKDICVCLGQIFSEYSIVFGRLDGKLFIFRQSGPGVLERKMVNRGRTKKRTDLRKMMNSNISEADVVRNYLKTMQIEEEKDKVLCLNVEAPLKEQLVKEFQFDEQNLNLFGICCDYLSEKMKCFYFPVRYEAAKEFQTHYY
jgi:hypothetical protein